MASHRGVGKFRQSAVHLISQHKVFDDLGYTLHEQLNRGETLRFSDRQCRRWLWAAERLEAVHTLTRYTERLPADRQNVNAGQVLGLAAFFSSVFLVANYGFGLGASTAAGVAAFLAFAVITFLLGIRGVTQMN